MIPSELFSEETIAAHYHQVVGIDANTPSIPALLFPLDQGKGGETPGRYTYAWSAPLNKVLFDKTTGFTHQEVSYSGNHVGYPVALQKWHLSFGSNLPDIVEGQETKHFHLKSMVPQDVISASEDIFPGSIVTTRFVLNKDAVSSCALKYALFCVLIPEKGIQMALDDSDQYIRRYIENLGSITRAGVELFCYEFRRAEEVKCIASGYFKELPLDYKVASFSAFAMLDLNDKNPDYNPTVRSNFVSEHSEEFQEQRLNQFTANLAVGTITGRLHILDLGRSYRKLLQNSSSLISFSTASR